MHKEWVLKAASKKKHILCEKLLLTLEDSYNNARVIDEVLKEIFNNN